MEEILPIDENNQIAKVDLDTIKSVYYWLNAKPDTNIKVYKESRKVSFADIVQLNESVQEKLVTHSLFTNITSVNVIFENGKMKSFAAWDEFCRTPWEISEVTESISISWDINLSLPNFKLPQRHTMKVRIGSSLKPGEFFQMMTSSDDDIEIIETKSFLVCKVDFINGVISNELISIVDNWYNCLKKVKSKSWFHDFVEKNNTTIARLSHYLVPLAGLSFLYTIFKYHLKQFEQVSFNKTIYEDLFFWTILVFVTYFAFNFFGTALGQRVFKIINKLDSPAIFEITRGDKNSQDNIDAKNKSLISQLNLQIWLTVFGTILSVILTKIIEHYL